MSPADDDDKEGEGFLSAWSRRKLAARSRQAESDEPETIEPLTEDEAEAVSEEPVEPDDDLVDDDFIASLPSIEDITDKTDLAPFMRRGVPLGLRNAALRKVWMLNPLIRDHVDAALDYAWDWNAPGGVPGGGGTLTGESVAQMVKTVLGDKKPRVASSAEDDAETDVAQADDPSPEVAEALPEEPLRRSETTDGGAPAEESGVPQSVADDDDEAGEQARVNLTPAAIRRHGGALPD